ncbi:hypothetical protein N7495_001211 [Penicillium taxi]|uniref:uncharacterized protein n=1 Tax=Penicillium taxi TaxID=168475 RepID=UPI002544F382|nr:uncharacterized protein N7495_001211 [Penicillium taxi]KAJ5908529.1 hypothetical protein N7495_001211 [Penicillium taxi]
MSSDISLAASNALDAERELLRCLAEKEPTFAEISHFLTTSVPDCLNQCAPGLRLHGQFIRFRSACQNAILLNFEMARDLDMEDPDVESRLWDAHVKLNSRFRKLLSRHREENSKKKPVEKRKLEKHYLDFIKSSQRFYRGYIQHLSSHFGGIVELDKVARKFNFESAQISKTKLLSQWLGTDNKTPLDLSAYPSSTVAPELRNRILKSCHATLNRLGDLSRYRETELASKVRNWGPAIGYYDLALAIYPASGASHNQLAVIALVDGNHFRATYHLYRALSAQEPHPSARGNLEIEFRKVMNAWAKRELIRPEDARIPGKALYSWFVYLHAQCYKGNDFPELDELESEVMSQLAVEIRERSLEGTLQKICMVNIAAEAFARARSVEEPVSNACVFLQRINVKTFFTLLQILLVELERFAVEDSSNKDSKNGSDKVTVVARRIMPALRLYSSWLGTTSDLLVAQKEEKDSSLSIQIQEFWKIYAGTLTLLASTFDITGDVTDIDYLLEEDEESLGFAPLGDAISSSRITGDDEQLKPRMTDPGVERSHPNMEMLYRVRAFVIDGLYLVVGKKIPIALVDDEEKNIFVYQEEGLPSQFFSSPPGRENTLSAANIEREDIPQPAKNPNSVGEGLSIFGGSQSASASISANMYRIVEDMERLVESDTCEDAPPVSDQFAFMNDPRAMAAPSVHVKSSTNSFPYSDFAAPMAPPGLGPPVVNAADSLRASAPRSFTPMPTIPSIPSIWNDTSAGPLRNGPSPRTPPGLGQQPPPHATNGSNINVSELSPSQQQIESELRQYNLRNQNQLTGSLDANGSMASSWMPPPGLPTAQSRPISTTWDRDPLAPMTLGSYSNATPNQSWANNAFIASSLASGAGNYNSPFSGNRKSSTQLGAIGQTPPCGQGG